MRRSAASALLDRGALRAARRARRLRARTGPRSERVSKRAADRQHRAPRRRAADPELDAFLAAIAGHAPTDPDALVAAVVAAGFPRDAIERTREVDSLGAPVTLLQIAVLDGDSCIVGQVGDGEPMAIRAAPLGGGRCLVGEIVTVD